MSARLLSPKFDTCCWSAVPTGCVWQATFRPTCACDVSNGH